MNARLLTVVVVVLALLSMAPAVGDVGGCGEQATPLDVAEFAQARKEEDCLRCTECGLTTPRCARACNEELAPETLVPETCKPLRHDGDVCLRALHAASCDKYATYVDENAPAAPSECRFCRLAPPPASFTDGGFP